MAATKSSDGEYTVRKNEKISDSTGRRTQKHKLPEHTESPQLKKTRAKTRTCVADDCSQNSLMKVRDKSKISSDSVIDNISGHNKKDITTENALLPKKDIELISKKDGPTSTSPKKDATNPGKKELMISCSRKETENGDQPKKEVHTLAVSKKEGEVISHKIRKTKQKMCSVLNEKKTEDKFNAEIRSDVSVSDKSKMKDEKIRPDVKENGNSSKVGEKPEIMNSDVSSSGDVPKKNTHVVDIQKKNVKNHAPSILFNNKDGIWKLGDIAWGRVGQHPFWPCMIAIDHQTGQYCKTKRVGRGLNSVQQSLHVQFFGDKGRHSWIPSTCVIKYEGKEQFEKFADKILSEMKKKDKKILSAFMVKPASKPKWEIAIQEAEETIPKNRDERLIFFQELLPKKISKVPEKIEKKNDVNRRKSAQPKKKIQRPSPSNEGKPSKLAKNDRGQIASKIQMKEKKIDNSSSNTHSKKKSGHNKKQIGEFDSSGTSSTNIPRVGLFLRRNIRKMLQQ